MQPASNPSPKERSVLPPQAKALLATAQAQKQRLDHMKENLPVGTSPSGKRHARAVLPCLPTARVLCAI